MREMLLSFEPAKVWGPRSAERKRLADQTSHMDALPAAKRTRRACSSINGSTPLLTQMLPKVHRAAVPRTKQKAGKSESKALAKMEDDALLPLACPYIAAKRSLSPTSQPTELLGRASEQAAMLSFVVDHIADRKAGSLYISGQPGTGKTATVTKVQQLLQDIHPGLRFAVVNCMARTPAHIFDTIAQALSLSMKRGLSARAVLDAKFQGGQGIRHVLVLDEVDQLMTHDKDILYKVFEWPQLVGANVLLIGIANGLDLTDRVLPFLKTRGCHPHSLNFATYTKQQLTDILHDRLQGLLGPDHKPILHERAIELCAAKVTAVNGDLRCALDIMTQAIDAVRRTPDQNHVLIMHRIVGAMDNQKIISRIVELPLHQQVVLCALSQLSGEITLDKLHRQYLGMLQQGGMLTDGGRGGFVRSLSPQQLLRELVEPVKDEGYVDIKQKMAQRDWKIVLRVAKDDVVRALQGRHPFTNWLRSAACGAGMP